MLHEFSLSFFEKWKKRNTAKKKQKPLNCFSYAGNFFFWEHDQFIKKMWFLQENEVLSMQKRKNWSLDYGAIWEENFLVRFEFAFCVLANCGVPAHIFQTTCIPTV